MSVDKQAVPADVEIGPYQNARFLARQGARKILEMLVQITGAAEPEEFDLFVSETDDEDVAELKSAMVELRGD